MPRNMTSEASVSAGITPEGEKIPSARKDRMAFTAEAVRDELTANIKELVGASPGGTVKERLRSAARYLGLPFSRVQDYWHGEVRRIEAHEADQIRAYYKAAKELIEARADYERRRQEFLRTHPRLARFAPAALAEDEISAEATAAAASELSRRK